MAEEKGAQARGPLIERYRPGFWGSVRELARFAIGPRFERVDLTELNDENDPPGLVLQKGMPATMRELYEKVAELQDQGGAGPLMIDRGYGFRPEVDRSSPVPISGGGAPIVGAARMLREVQEGRRPMPTRAHHPEARAILDEIHRQRGEDEPLAPQDSES